MKESDFIKQNKEKWLGFEKNLSSNDNDPVKASKLYTQITDDLSYAHTFYPNRTVKLYLNGIAKLLFNELNKSHKKNTSTFLQFWKTDLPLAIFRARRAMLISFLTFVFCFSLGMITSAKDKTFASLILGHNYVNMTDANIASGDPLAVYKSESETRTFLPILLNNLKVEFLTFFTGIFMAIGSLVIMIMNGVMVGTFQYYFIDKGLFWESFLTIWTHGTLEISTIILSGGAGLTLGQGLLFPGTHTRLQALKMSGQRGLIIIMGVVPFTCIAALIEGFLTRHTGLPDVVRLLFILCSLAFVIMYFFLYPRRVANRVQFDHDNTTRTLVLKPEVKFDTAATHAPGKLITETFRFLFENAAFFGRFLLAIPLFCAILIAINPFDLFISDYRNSFHLSDFFNYTEFPAIGVLSISSYLLMSIVVLNFIQKRLAAQSPSTSGPLIKLKSAVTLVIGALALTLPVYTGIDFATLIAQLIFPFIVFYTCTSVYQSLPAGEALAASGKLLYQSLSRFLICGVFFMMLALIMFAVTSTGLRILLLEDALTMALTDDDLTAARLQVGFSAFQVYFIFLIYLTLSIISNVFVFYTLREILTAEHLIIRIRKITAIK